MKKPVFPVGAFRQSRTLVRNLSCAAIVLIGSVVQGAPIPDEIKGLTAMLRKLGEETLATQLEKDILSNKITIGGDGPRAETGIPNMDIMVTTRHLFGSGTTNNAMRINKSILGDIGSGSVENLVGWALTVRHEYIHMGQYHPRPSPEFENPAYREVIKTGTGWYGTIKTELEEALQAPPTKENLDKVKELRTLTKAIGSQMGEIFNDMSPLIKDKSLAQDTWWTLDHGRATTLDEARSKNANVVGQDLVKLDGEIKNFKEAVDKIAKDKEKDKDKPIADKEADKGQTKDTVVKKTTAIEKPDVLIAEKDKLNKKETPPPTTERKSSPAAIPEKQDMQGSYAGTVKMMDSTGTLNITVTGDKVSGTYTENYFKDLGPATTSRKINASVSGKVDPASGAIEMLASGTINVVVITKPGKPVKGFDNTPPPPVTNTQNSTWNFSGSFTGSGFSGGGSTASWPWSVTRTSGAAETKSQEAASNPASPPPQDVPNKGGTLTAADGSRTVLTYRKDSTGKMVPVTTEYDSTGRQIRQTTVDKKGQTVPVR